MGKLIMPPTTSKTPMPSVQPPKNGSTVQHEHKWVHINTAYSKENCGYNTGWYRHDTYFCEKCLEQKTVTKTEYSRDMPEWYKHN